MADEPSSPYRAVPKAELSVSGGASTAILTYAALAGLVFFAVAWGFGFVQSVGALPSVVIFGTLAFLAVWTSRRNRWRFTLERSTLRVERLLPGGTRRIGALDVHQGIRVKVDVPEQVAGADARFSLSAGGEEIHFFPGGRARELHGELVRFLREQQVEVDAPELPALPDPGPKLPGL